MLTEEKIKEILKEKLKAQKVMITDDSHRHARHLEAQKYGGGHYVALVVSRAFEGKTLVQRHRMVYQALQKELKNSIHALALETLTENEFVAIQKIRKAKKKQSKELER